MTGIDRRDGTPLGPPWPLELLADLHAGALDDAVAGELWPQVQRDPEARATLDALDATRVDLGSFAAVTGPVPPMPADLAARLDAALAAEVAAAFTVPQQNRGPAPAPQPSNVIDLAKARRNRNRRLGWGAGILVAAAAAVGLIVATLPGTTPAPGGSAAPPPGGGVTLTGLNASALTQSMGRKDFGPLTGDRLAACLSANHADPNRTPAGAIQATLNGRAGTLLVLTTGQLAQFRLLMVGPDCGVQGNPDTIADSVVGGMPTPTR